MRVHVVRHVEFEGPGTIAAWAAERGHELTESLAANEAFPPTEDIDFLVLMGGPMSADDHDAHEWRTAEDRYVTQAMQAGRLVLGVCLGAQIIALATGGSVRRADEREVGWYPVWRTAEADSEPVFDSFPERLTVGHWHADTVVLPASAWPALSSAACENQAFALMAGRVVGLQFHLEWDAHALNALIDECAEEFDTPGPYVQSPGKLAAGAVEHAGACRTVLFGLLDSMAALGSVTPPA